MAGSLATPQIDYEYEDEHQNSGSLANVFLRSFLTEGAPAKLVAAILLLVCPQLMNHEIITLTNNAGLDVTLTRYGATLISITVPDRIGGREDVLLGFDNPASYETPNPYFGAIVGRYGNRIANGRFALDGKTYQLATNDGPNHLHGGIHGFDKALWTILGRSGDSVEFEYVSADGEEEYPGKLTTRFRYSVTPDSELVIDYHAQTDQPTVLNLTNHAYFNLATGGDSNIEDHLLMLNADSYTPVDTGCIPTGEIASVADTPFDFRSPTLIGARIAADNDQLRFGQGYDHNYVLNKSGSELSLAATVLDPASGRFLEVRTTQPGIQFYSGNQLKGNVRGKRGITYQRRSGFCLETQHYPDSPNRPNFPSTVLRPGETYQQQTIYRFAVQ
ncbi:MAG: galactose mutarotase [Verrucomicrobia bacterium]|nr:galactose mutarotase [Verrucomicrobiota bacterium]